MKHFVTINSYEYMPKNTFCVTRTVCVFKPPCAKPDSWWMSEGDQLFSKSLPGITCMFFRYWVLGIGFNLQPRNFVFSADSFSCFYLYPLELEMLKRVIKIRYLLSVAKERNILQSRRVIGKRKNTVFYKPSIVRPKQASVGKREWLKGIAKLGTVTGHRWQQYNLCGSIHHCSYGGSWWISWLWCYDGAFEPVYGQTVGLLPNSVTCGDSVNPCRPKYCP